MNISKIPFVCFALILTSCLFVSCNRNDETGAQTKPGEADDIQKLQTKHLPNAVKLHEKVITGGLPADDAAFAELADLGVKTIISVDGAKPDVDAAKKHGLKYVHLPHGYDGISDERAKDLAKAVNELEGPIYIHCHHGKHRSPAAGAVACVGAGLITPEQSLGVLELAGTSKDYVGLYKAAGTAKRFEKELLAQLETEFKPIVEVPPMAQAMVDLEVPFHHLQLLSENHWRVMKDHPDVIPSHEALILREHFTELQRTSESKSYGADFLNWLKSSETSAVEIHTRLKSIEHMNNEARAAAVKEIDQHLLQIKNDCRACHIAYRNKARQN